MSEDFFRLHILKILHVEGRLFLVFFNTGNMKTTGIRVVINGLLKLWVILPIIDMIHPKCNTFVSGVKCKATSD